MDFLFFLFIIFVVVSMVGGVSQASKGSKGTYNNKYRLDDFKEYKKEYTGSAGRSIQSLSDLKNEVMRELNSANQQLNGGTTKNKNAKNQYKSSEKYAQIPGEKRKGFNNHSLSRDLINDEMTDSNKIWMEEQAKMYEINKMFNDNIARQHAENEKLMYEASKIDMK